MTREHHQRHSILGNVRGELPSASVAVRDPCIAPGPPWTGVTRWPQRHGFARRRSFNPKLESTTNKNGSLRHLVDGARGNALLVAPYECGGPLPG
jgi:hypothetical protein